MQTPWIADLMLAAVPVKLDRAGFVARYLPQYVREYEAPRGIRLRSDGRPTRTLPGNVKAQVTKREARISEAFAHYELMFSEVEKLNKRA